MLEYDPKLRIQWKELYSHPYFEANYLSRVTNLDISLSKNKLIYEGDDKSQLI